MQNRTATSLRTVILRYEEPYRTATSGTVPITTWGTAVSCSLIYHVNRVQIEITASPSQWRAYTTMSPKAIPTCHHYIEWGEPPHETATKQQKYNKKTTALRRTNVVTDEIVDTL